MSVRKKEKTAAFDVVIIGGGMTGLCAALASARHGASTALVQERPVLGGNASSEIRMHICGASADMTKPDAEETGILRELLLENKRVNAYYNYSVWDRVLFETAKSQQGLTLFLNATLYDAVVEEGRITRALCYQMTTETHWTLAAPLFCDCTGNGTLAYLAGAPYRQGSEARSEFQEPHAPEAANNCRMGNTLLFKAVDRGEPVSFVPPKGAYTFSEEQLRYRKHADVKPNSQALQAEKQASTLLDKVDEKTRDMVFDAYCLDYGYWWIELTGERADIIDEYEDIRDELVKCVYGVWDHIKNGGDHGADHYDLQWVGMLPGVRESRRIEGEYILNENDILSNRQFPDAVAYGGWAVDNHVAHGLLDFDKLPSEIYPFEGLYTIPYRSYVARGLTNLLVGGRCMSASKLAMASSRVMGTCAVGGQAIGTAAALCKKHGCEPRGLMAYIAELQQTLLKDDCYIPGLTNQDDKDVARRAIPRATSEKERAAGVINGVARAVGDQANCWQSDGLDPRGETLTLSLAAPARIGQVRLTFDPNLNVSAKITLSSKRMAEQVRGVPPELVQDYDVSLRLQGRTVARRQVRDNYQRLNMLYFTPVLCDEIDVTVLRTHGFPDARIYEVRAYEK